jgi:hypothetical protein
MTNLLEPHARENVGKESVVSVKTDKLWLKENGTGISPEFKFGVRAKTR